MNLLLDWCSYEAAKYACEHWHYSKCVPVAKLNAIGVWEDSKFIGCIVFSYGANNNIAKPYGLTQYQCVELTRVALKDHKTPVTKLVKIALKFLRKKNKDLELVVSYADLKQGHYGGIYQAGNLVFVGATADTTQLINGKEMHRRSVYSTYGTNSTKELKKRFGVTASFIKTDPKFKYLYPLSDDMRRKIEPLRKPYPKKGVGSVNGSTSAFQAESGGSIPTPTHGVRNACR